MDFLDFIRKVHEEKKAQGFVTKGGKGSGWYAPPKGTHGKGKKGRGSRTMGRGKAVIHIVKPGTRLPESKTKQEATVLLDTRNRLVVGDRNRTHAEIIHQIGEDKNFDRIIRGGVTKKKGRLRLEVWTSYSGVGRDVFGADADVAAAKNIKGLARAMVSAGYPSSMKLVWHPITSSLVSSTVGAWKSFQNGKILTTIAHFIDSEPFELLGIIGAQLCKA